jgi:hypothetical protein
MTLNSGPVSCHLARILQIVSPTNTKTIKIRKPINSPVLYTKKLRADQILGIVFIIQFTIFHVMSATYSRKHYKEKSITLLEIL